MAQLSMFSSRAIAVSTRSRFLAAFIQRGNLLINSRLRYGQEPGTSLDR